MTDFGYLTLISGYEHGLLHCARHIVAGNSELIYDTDNGRSGMVACLLLLPIVLPMKFEFFRTRVRKRGVANSAEEVDFLRVRSILCCPCCRRPL